MLSPTQLGTQMIQQQPMYPVPNQNQMTEYIVSNLLISKISDVINGDFQLSITNVTKILLLLSSGEIKNGVNTILEYFVSMVKQIPSLAITLAMFFSKFIKSSDHANIELGTSPTNIETLNINMEQNFLISFCLYIMKNENCSFKETICDCIVKNNTEIIISKKIDNVTMKFDNYTLELIEPLVINYDILSDNIISVKCNSLGTTLHYNKYSDLLSNEQENIVTQIYEQVCVFAKKDNISVLQYVERIVKYNPTQVPRSVNEKVIADLLVEKYPSFDKDRTFIELIIVGQIICFFHKINPMSSAHESITTNNLLIFDRNNTYKLPEGIACNGGYQYAVYFPSNFITTLNNPNIKDIFKSFAVPLSKFDDSNRNAKCTFMITQTTKDITHKKYIYNNFIKTIMGSYKKTSKKIKIFSIKLEQDITEKEIINNEYTEYENKKKLLEARKDPDEFSKMEYSQFLNKPIPSKTIISQTIKNKIECKQLNEIEKDISTLFLKKKDKEKLMNGLDMFKNKGHVLQEIGLQHKFNVLLHGKPGTGKSTSIMVIASDLKRDIYYINMQNVILNEDLQLLFDYVNKHVTAGGIIVIEDIDLATPIVLQRKNESGEYNINDVINKQKSKLTLEYLLNILNGTLTVDNSIFIMTTNAIDSLDAAFIRPGRFDVNIELQECDRYQISEIYLKMIGKVLPENILQSIPEYKFTPADVMYHIKNYIFDKHATMEEILEPFIEKV